MISKDKLEKNQVTIYIITLLLAGFIGLNFSQFQSQLENLIPIFLGILMYSMFVLIPFAALKESLSNRRFFYALCIVNFIAVPIVVWGLTFFIPDYPPLLLGVYLVLLTPCIDYVIVFTALGKGNEKAMLSATPFLFVAQMLLLPFYLWLFIGEQAANVVEVAPFVKAFVTFIVLPLSVALIVQLLSKEGGRVYEMSSWLPVPFMAFTLFVIVASQIGRLAGSFEWILKVIPIYIVFMIIMPFISKMVGKWLKLDIRTGRALIFSGSTRNSLVVLPFALALPEEIRLLVVAVIVTQTIVEIIGELIYIRIIPQFVLRDK
ncbi:arsenic resistance protein [Solibacillus isronensis]|uniref:arsenic resistance protein n=1 Tax=Solibacillus isronensis TaxID=412383 RepID=UPI0020415261|nr:arsenic resistance protein [Solibacillus isronensis]MCM3721746.1 arsenic resistance protein [Solibacillus isronensis]